MMGNFVINGQSSSAVQVLSVAQTAEALGVSVRTVHSLIGRGRLRASKVGRLTKIRAADLEEFLISSRIQPLVAA